MPVSPKIFIDGSSGTTGLRIRDWLAPRDDIEILAIDPDKRRNESDRQALYKEADLVVLCLPDDAAHEAAHWAIDIGTRVIDASTAHRVTEGWTYGLPELSPEQREAIREERTVSNPGCYPTGVILGIGPLVSEGFVSADAPITVHALSGYSGGGKSVIADWSDESSELNELPFESPYAIHTEHKHIPEMTQYSGFTYEPQFTPSVGPFITGMRLEIPLHNTILREDSTAEGIREFLSERYKDEKFVRVLTVDEAMSYSHPAFDPRGANDTNRIDFAVLPNELGHIMVIAIYDNLGKGACGAAIQNMNLMLGLPEDAGLSA
jgi:N-acetyl-gamma-glutamyl-phosphate reductase